MCFCERVQVQCLPQPHRYLLKGGIAATQVCIFANMVMELELDMLWMYMVCMTQLFSCCGETLKLCCDNSGGIKLLQKYIQKSYTDLNTSFLNENKPQIMTWKLWYYKKIFYYYLLKLILCFFNQYLKKKCCPSDQSYVMQTACRTKNNNIKNRK